MIVGEVTMRSSIMSTAGTVAVSLFLSVLAFVSGCSSGGVAEEATETQEPLEVKEVTVQPGEDLTGLVRNPAMGWVMYADAFADFPQADEYWKSQDPYAGSASIFYIRLPWSQLEPQEGLYAWEYDQNFKDLVQGALDRGLKLAFRVYVDSEGSYRQATPAYVRDAGAEGVVDADTGRWDPYVDDPVFQEKFSAFLDAFGGRFNDPGLVDFVDGNGLGRWGEGNRLKLKGDDVYGVLRWISGAYAKSFNRVLLGVQYNKSQTGFGLDNIDAVAIDEYGYVIRKDTLGLPYWFTEADKERIRSRFPEVPFYGENVYQYLQSRRRWADDYDTLREALEAVMNDALSLHANTLDLRIPEDTEAWFSEAPDLVQEFMVRGGYRLVPVEVTFPGAVERGGWMTVSHVWKNTGVGVLPNNRPQWNYKYKVAFALIEPETERVAFIAVDRVAEPSDWVEGGRYAYSLNASIDDSVPAGTYRLGCAIVDTTKGNVPALNLAVVNERTGTGWYILGDVTVH
ncbi:MAG TPA: DUF4832 domain-containing protein [Nitrospirae bacterium]|nr:DUF4832 domain-containing protein [Nitrospirota bacterium]